VVEESRAREGAYQTYVRVVVETERGERSIAGTVFSMAPRVFQIKGIGMEASLDPTCSTSRSRQAGLHGRFGSLMGSGRQHRTLSLAATAGRRRDLPRRRRRRCR